MKVRDYYPYLLGLLTLVVVLWPQKAPPAPDEFGSISSPPTPVIVPLDEEGAASPAAKPQE